MRLALAGLIVAALSVPGCVTYEYEHEFWLKVDGSGRVFVTGQPWLWTAFKGLPATAGDDEAARAAARGLFERSGLRVRRVTVTRRQGRPYLFVAADFDDFSRLSGTPAFPDLDVRLARDGERLRLEGTWRHRPIPSGGTDASGLMAVRFHLPSKVYEHKNAANGVERGNIVAWRQGLTDALKGQPLVFGALMDRRSILWSTVGLFAVAIVLALATLGTGLFFAFRRGRGGPIPATSSASPESRNRT
jgi:hypothetical protein